MKATDTAKATGTVTTADPVTATASSGPSVVTHVSSRSGMQARFTTSGALRRLEVDDRSLLLYPADELEAGPANLYLRIRRDDYAEAVALVGPGSGSTVSWG